VKISKEIYSCKTRRGSSDKRGARRNRRRRERIGSDHDGVVRGEEVALPGALLGGHVSTKHILFFVLVRHDSVDR